MNPPAALDGLTSAQLKELVVELLDEVAALKQTVGSLREEVARLKGLKGRPDIKPSGMDAATEPTQPREQGKRPGRGKVRPCVSVEDRIIKAAVPAGSRFKGYETYQVQELVLSAHAVRYLRERWVTPDGRTIVAPLPEGIRGHFGPDLRRFVLMQYHQAQSTLPRLTALLQSVGLSISKREIQRMLTEQQDDFLDEARDVLRAGLKTSPWVSVDDTGARHKAKNNFCTQIGNDRFTWFGTRASKSRLNFLDLLRAGHTDFVLNEAAFSYMRARGLSAALIASLAEGGETRFVDQKTWQAHLGRLGIVRRILRLCPEHRRSRRRRLQPSVGMGDQSAAARYLGLRGSAGAWCRSGSPPGPDARSPALPRPPGRGRSGGARERARSSARTGGTSGTRRPRS